MATVSPDCTDRSSPSNTGVRILPSAYVMARPSARMASPSCFFCIALLIAQRLRRSRARGAPGGIDGGEERHDERDDGDDRHVASLQVRRQAGDVVHILG